MEALWVESQCSYLVSIWCWKFKVSCFSIITALNEQSTSWRNHGSSTEIAVGEIYSAEPQKSIDLRELWMSKPFPNCQWGGKLKWKILFLTPTTPRLDRDPDRQGQAQGHSQRVLWSGFPHQQVEPYSTSLEPWVPQLCASSIKPPALVGSPTLSQNYG